MTRGDIVAPRGSLWARFRSAGRGGLGGVRGRNNPARRARRHARASTGLRADVLAPRREDSPFVGQIGSPGVDAGWRDGSPPFAVRTARRHIQADGEGRRMGRRRPPAWFWRAHPSTSQQTCRHPLFRTNRTVGRRDAVTKALAERHRHISGFTLRRQRQRAGFGPTLGLSFCMKFSLVVVAR